MLILMLFRRCSCIEELYTKKFTGHKFEYFEK